MSILKPINEETTYTENEIKNLIAKDLNINPKEISLFVHIELSNGESYWKDSPKEKFSHLIAQTTVLNKKQEFKVTQQDIKDLFNKYKNTNLTDENFSFRYQKEYSGPRYELLDITINKSLETAPKNKIKP